MSKINALQEKEHLNQYFLIKSCSKGVTSKGAPYLNLVFQDNTGTIDAKLWDAKEEDEEIAVAGSVVEVNAEVLKYNNALQLRVNSISKVEKEKISMEDYLISSRYSEAQLRQEISAYISSLKNENLKTLVKGMFVKVDDRFYQYPAASRIHHGYMGGLAEHTLGMANLAEEICKLYPSLNRDLLLSGILVHDMGKTVELGGLVSTEYSEEGKLTGHISICHGWLMEVADEKGLADSEEALLLRHLILSHHGKLEFGSPVLPLIKEAEILSYIDNMDARMNTLNAALEKVEKGQWSQKINAMEGRQFYKPKL